MIEIALMVEGQNGLNWENWQRIAKLCEELGFVGLYRSDHFTNQDKPDLDSLELWVSLTWLACNTKRIEFGPLVSPVSFRHPAMTARMASAVDDLSGGRLQLGLGAGWQEREHNNYSYDLLKLAPRFERFEEGLKIITHLLHETETLDLQGSYYQMNDAVLLPRPQRPGGPPIVIGGNGPKYTLPLVAKYADEWNAVYRRPEKFKATNRVLTDLLIEKDRDPASVRRSMMTGLIIGKDDEAVNGKLGERTKEQYQEIGALVGTPSEIKEQVARLDDAGVQRVMLQWLDLDDTQGLELLAKTLL